MKKAVVTGGAGFVGFSLASQLASSGAWGEVLLLDLAPPRAPAPLPSCMAVQIGDVGCAEDVMQACRGADLVVHVAAYGMSGAECRDAERIRHVNVTGTKLLLAACLAQGVGRLLFLSSYNAVFDGRRPQPGMTEESAAHVSPASCRDTYSVGWGLGSVCEGSGSDSDYFARFLAFAMKCHVFEVTLRYEIAALRTALSRIAL
ncbi:hypothetical protein V8C86DRAFT_3011421 [Haematococcus lacustris]